MASKVVGVSHRPSSKPAWTSVGKSASPTMRTGRRKEPTVTVSPAATRSWRAVSGPMAASPSAAGALPEVVARAIAPRPGLTEKTGTPAPFTSATSRLTTAASATTGTAAMESTRASSTPVGV
jgi:hypothetical protein